MMKKILVALAMFPMVAAANDLSAGTLELTGDSNLSFNSGSVKVKDGSTTDTTDYGLGATGLYYVTPNVGIGASLQYSNSKEKVGGVESGLSTLLVGPAVGVDFPVAPQVSFFGRGAVGYASSTLTETGSPDFDLTGYGFTVEAGVKYFVTKAFSLDAGLGYDWLQLKKSPAEITTSGFGVNVGLSVYFGNK
jgi:hypothetical protein